MDTAELYINPKFFTGLFLPDWLLEMDLSLSAMVCYAKLARLAQTKGYAFPKIDYMASMLRVSKRQAHSYLRELKKADLIAVKRTGRASNYRLLWYPAMGEPDGSKLHIRYEENCISDMKQTSDPLKERTESEKGKKNSGKPLPNSNIKVFIDWWFNRYQQLVGVKYHVTGKDAQLVQRLLGTYPLETLQEHAEQLLSTKDPWLVKRGRTISTLSGEWNKLAQEGHLTYRPGIDGPGLDVSLNFGSTPKKIED